MSFSEDQHPVGEFGADGQHEAFGETVCARALGRDLDHLDTGIVQRGVERVRELSGAVADQQPEPRRPLEDALTAKVNGGWRRGCSKAAPGLLELGEDDEFVVGSIVVTVGGA